MENFAEQCLDMARSILSHNLDAIEDNGTISPFPNENATGYESGHAAFAIGEYFRATNEETLEGHNLLDLAARTITAQAFAQESHEGGLAFASLGLLSFGSAKDRNPIWERLLEPTREQLDLQLLERNDYNNHLEWIDGF